MKKICVVEDNEDILNDITFILSSHDYKVVPIKSYSAFISSNELVDIDFYLLDWDLSEDGNGLDIVSKIRETDKEVPIFMVTANTMINDVVTALKKGANDYIRKPFSFEELLIKIEKFFINKTNKIDSLELLPSSFALKYMDALIVLTAREYLIFETLFKSKGKVFSRDDLVSVFADDSAVQNRNIDVHVFSLRKKISNVPMEIKAIRSVGYVLEG